MIRGRTERETCELNGWTVGTRLVGDEGYGPAVIRLAYIGPDVLVAACESRNGVPTQGLNAQERQWTLTCREWTEAAARPTPEEPQS